MSKQVANVLRQYLTLRDSKNSRPAKRCRQEAGNLKLKSHILEAINTGYWEDIFDLYSLVPLPSCSLIHFCWRAQIYTKKISCSAEDLLVAVINIPSKVPQHSRITYVPNQGDGGWWLVTCLFKEERSHSLSPLFWRRGRLFWWRNHS